MTNASEPPVTDTDQHISIGEFVGKPKPQLRQISFLAIADLTSAPHNPRKHTSTHYR